MNRENRVEFSGASFDFAALAAEYRQETHEALSHRVEILTAKGLREGWLARTQADRMKGMGPARLGAELHMIQKLTLRGRGPLYDGDFERVQELGATFYINYFSEYDIFYGVLGAVGGRFPDAARIDGRAILDRVMGVADEGLPDYIQFKTHMLVERGAISDEEEDYYLWISIDDGRRDAQRAVAYELELMFALHCAGTVLDERTMEAVGQAREYFADVTRRKSGLVRNHEMLLGRDPGPC